MLQCTARLLSMAEVAEDPWSADVRLSLDLFYLLIPGFASAVLSCTNGFDYLSGGHQMLPC